MPLLNKGGKERGGRRRVCSGGKDAPPKKKKEKIQSKSRSREQKRRVPRPLYFRDQLRKGERKRVCFPKGKCPGAQRLLGGDGGEDYSSKTGGCVSFKEGQATRKGKKKRTFQFVGIGDHLQSRIGAIRAYFPADCGRGEASEHH